MELYSWLKIIILISGLAYNQVSFLAPYEGGVWKVRVDLPDKYPFKSPSIGQNGTHPYDLYSVCGDSLNITTSRSWLGCLLSSVYTAQQRW